MRPILDYIYGHNIVLCVCEGWGGGMCPLHPSQVSSTECRGRDDHRLKLVVDQFCLEFRCKFEHVIGKFPMGAKLTIASLGSSLISALIIFKGL